MLHTQADFDRMKAAANTSDVNDACHVYHYLTSQPVATHAP
jgi:hypothetical protein